MSLSVDGFQALNRFGLGPAPGEAQEVGNDPRGWLKRQVAQGVLLLAPDTQGLKLTEQLFSAKRDKRQNLADDNKDAAKAVRQWYIAQSGERFIASVQTQQPFIERLVAFWSNHFTVSIQKKAIAGLVNDYEAQAIRPYVLGSFSDMLLAAIQHPAMLLYLDNARSVGPHSRAGLRRDRGLNENVAREILELHTLGVDGGYTQQDVTEFAKILTGWSFARYEEQVELTFAFQPQLHEPGPKTLLGQTFDDGGMEEGMEALRMLAHHPMTARHVATKLARHFISDTPPESAIARLAQVFSDSQGDLEQVSLALVDLQEIWDSPLTKLKTPYEFAVSTMRFLGAQPRAEQVMRGLDMLDFRPFDAPSPAGYPDTAEQWASADMIIKRVEWVYAIAQRVKGSIDPQFYFASAIEPVASDETRQTIERAASATDALALLLASPEFQRR